MSGVMDQLQAEEEMEFEHLRCQFLPVITESSDQTPHGSPSPSGSRPSTASHSGINRPVSGTSRQEEGLTDPNSRPTSGSPRPAPQMSGSGSRPQSATMSPGLRQPPRSSPIGSRPSSGRSAHSSVSAGGHNREGSSYLNAGFQEDTPPSHGKGDTDKNPAMKKYGDAKIVAKKLKKKRSRKRDSEA